MNEAIEAMEAAAVTPAGEYMGDPTAARLRHLAMCHLEALINQGMTAREAMEAAKTGTAAAMDAAYREITGNGQRG